MILTNEDTIFTFLKANRVNYFIMGSTRFGYDTALSDIDICVFVSVEKARDLIIITNAVLEKPRDIIAYRGIQHATIYRTDFFHKAVHLLIWHTPSQYNLLKTEHEEVETFLKENKILKTYISHIKQQDSTINGGVLYKAVIRLIRINKILGKEEL